MILVEGYGIQDVMGKPGVDGKNTKTNHIVEVSNFLRSILNTFPHTHLLFFYVV
jgi:hypothetical protein